MSNAKIILKSKTKYEIEVNDYGDTITLDYADPNLLFNLSKMLKECEKHEVQYHNLKQYLTTEDDQVGNLSEEKLDKLANGLKEFYDNSKKSIDLFLGEGACKKIFVDGDYYEMFDDLFEQLKPHLDAVAKQSEKHFSNIRNKYDANKPNKKVI